MITVTLNKAFNISSIDVGGYCGDSSLWNSTNGAGAKINVSEDGCTWENVGILPGNFGKSIQSIKFQTQKYMKFIQFLHNTYLGLGYLKVYVNGGSSSSNSRVSVSIPLNANNDNVSGVPLPVDVNFIPYFFNGRQVGTSDVRVLCDGDLKTGKHFLNLK